MNYRIGHGYDVHKLQKGRELILGGVHIENGGIGLLGHSDADVLAHAVCDALLGAAALGDIGKHFPDTDEAYKNADSMVLLSKVCDLLKKNGYSVGNIAALRTNIAKACKIPLSDVSVKATTEEGLGFTGAKEGIAAHSVCIIIKEKEIKFI